MVKTGIHWFRHGLRLHDNPALYSCLDEVERFVPIFIFDGESAGTSICGYHRFRFLIESLKDLEKQFALIGVHFMCFYGKPHEVLEGLIKDWNVKVVSFEKDSEAIWAKRDNLVKEMSKKNEVQIIERVSHTLYDPEDIFNMNDNLPPNTCLEMREACKKIGEPEAAESKPDLAFISSNLVSNKSLYDPIVHKVPELERFDVKPDFPEQVGSCIYVGGETKALELLKKRIEYEIDSFKRGQINPNLTKPVIFTKEISLSPFLRFGCLSVRKFYWDITKAFQKHFHGPDKEKFGLKAADQLFWREYFYQLSYKNENFAKLDGNPMSYQIPWDYSGKMDKFEKFKSAKTGFPWIDACVRQVKLEGWIHHACRNSCAIFVTRGDLFLSWENGMNFFFHYLIDVCFIIHIFIGTK